MASSGPVSAPQKTERGRFFKLRVAVTITAWAALLIIVVRLLEAHDFGRAGELETVMARFAIETVLITALAYGLIRTLPFGNRPGPRGIIVLALWIALVVLGDCLSRLKFDEVEQVLSSLRDALGIGGLLIAMAIYALALALPFVPGIEIGLLIIMLFGAIGATAAYLATIGGLCLAFAAGRRIPERVCVRCLARLGVSMPAGRLESALADLLAANRPDGGMLQRMVTCLVAHRYLSLAVSLNLPGNSALGGGGGIALLCGASRQFEWSRFVLTVVLATSPIPVLVVFGGIDAGSLVRLHEALQGLLGKLAALF